MNKFRIILLLWLLLSVFFIFPTTSIAQNQFIGSGYTSLLLQLSGNMSKNINFSAIQICNPLSDEKTIEFSQTNDSTFFISEYTFGPTPISFRFNGQYLSTILLPNETDTLEIEILDLKTSKMNYKGRFEEVFINSDKQENLIKNIFSYPRRQKNDSVNNRLKTISDFKKYQLDFLSQMSKDLTENISSPFLKSYYLEIISMIKIPDLFLNKPDKKIESYKQQNMLENNIIDNKPLKRDCTYYRDIITSNFADTTSLLPGGYFSLLKTIRKDSILEFPDIQLVGIAEYKKHLQKVFGTIFPTDDNLFYDMFIASTYIEMINEDRFLDSKDKDEILRYFGNRHVRDYIFYQNTINSNQKLANVSFLTYSQKKLNIIDSILDKYIGKVVIIDFWATWCGPCIESFNYTKEIKKQYENKDVVFVYLTDESSDRNQFRGFARLLGGQHYYLYSSQFSSLLEKYKFEGIPSYLVFDRKGRLLEKLKFTKDLKNNMIAEIERAL